MFSIVFPTKKNHYIFLDLRCLKLRKIDKGEHLNPDMLYIVGLVSRERIFFVILENRYKLFNFLYRQRSIENYVFQEKSYFCDGPVYRNSL